jgi:hypothetical protein
VLSQIYFQLFILIEMVKTYILVIFNLMTWIFLTMIMSDWIHGLLKIEYLAALSFTFLVFYFIYYPKGSLHGLIRHDGFKIAYKKYYSMSIFIESYVSISVFIYFVFGLEAINKYLYPSSTFLMFIYVVMYIDYFLSTRDGFNKVLE